MALLLLPLMSFKPNSNVIFFYMKSYETTFFLAPARIKLFLPFALRNTLLTSPFLRGQKIMKECMFWPWKRPGFASQLCCLTLGVLLSLSEL